MKKYMVFIIFIVYMGTTLFTISLQQVSSEETYQTIPDEAIRLRILANSDSERDQEMKRVVRDQVSEYISTLVQEIDHIDVARTVIAENVPNIEKMVKETLLEEGMNQSLTVEYRSNVAFPTKIYGNHVYPAGEYEAVLISIGKAEGANWWCVLFPPLCFLDFSNGSTIATEDEDIGVDSEEKSEDSDFRVELDEDDERKENDLDKVEEEQDVDEEQVEADEEIEVKFFLLEWLGFS